MKKSVLICGDLVLATHIAKQPTISKGFSDGRESTQLLNTKGGAWYLQEMIQNAIEAYSLNASEESKIDVEVLAPQDLNGNAKWPSGVAKAFSVWKWYKNGKVKDGDGTWRISEFLGYHPSQWDSEHHELQIQDETLKPDILVIDDLGLGFTKHQECWPACLKNKAQYPNSIIVKGGTPFDSPLMQMLLDPASDLKDRLTLIFSVGYLRDMGGTISRGLSWDRTIDDLIREFSENGCARGLRGCHRVVALCGRSGAVVFSRVPRSPKEQETKPSALQFERFVFDPHHLEDTWSALYEGHSFGTGSMMTAAMVVHELLEIQPSTHISVCHGMAAARELHLHNGGHDSQNLQPYSASKKSFFDIHTVKPWTAFQSAFPRDLLDDHEVSESRDRLSLLTDMVGKGGEFLTAVAEDIVRMGIEKPLKGVPRLKYGSYITVDREEIENLNTVRRLIEDYRLSNDARPLSIAVFGAPGSGKSFAIKQLAKEVFGEQHATLEFNLSQFKGIEDLHEAFHEVRDKSIQKQIPLVFWDEFDSTDSSRNEEWLRHFLAPMQDALFQARGKAHLFGKCIFVFAGGRYNSFQQFDRSDTKPKKFKSNKGPDFVSRLRGYVNIKGPNPAKTDETSDEVSVIRRGLLLRSLIERHHPHLLHPETREIAINARVMAAFLRVEEYKHGARSMEAIVSLIHLDANAHLGPSELPPLEIIKFHVSLDFAAYLNPPGTFLESSQGNTYISYALSPADVERLAEIKHGRWMAEKKARGYIHGSVRNDHSNPPTHHLLKKYEELEDADKDNNRLPARLAVLRLEALGYAIMSVHQIAGDQICTDITKEDLEELAKSEHERWMREKLLKGYAYGQHSSDELLLHKDISKRADLPKGEFSLDRQIIEAIFDFLGEKGLVMVKKEKHLT